MIQANKMARSVMTGSVIGLTMGIWLLAQPVLAESKAPSVEEQAAEARIKPIGTVKEGKDAPQATAPAAAASGSDDPVATLIKQKGYPCFSCHQVETKLVGPSYKEVAAKYKDDASAAEKLAAKVKAGSTGTWGQVPMPPNPTVSDEDMKTIIHWVLSSGKAATATPAAAAPAASTGDGTTLTTEQATALIKEKGYICFTCHQVETKVVGPAYKEIAAKYKIQQKGNAEIIASLKKKIKEGGGGVWGQVPMSPNPTVSDEDLDKLVHWILSL